MEGPEEKITMASLCAKRNFLQSRERNQKRKQEWRPYHFWRVHSLCKNHSWLGGDPSAALPVLQKQTQVISWQVALCAHTQHYHIQAEDSMMTKARWCSDTASYWGQPHLEQSPPHWPMETDTFLYNTIRATPGQAWLKRDPSIKLVHPLLKSYSNSKHSSPPISAITEGIPGIGI